MTYEECSELADKLKQEGWGVLPPEQYHMDIEEEYFTLWDRVSSFTMTSPERGYALFKAVQYICDNNIPGSFVECGVWKGGSCMLTALALKRLYPDLRKGDDGLIYLYDTFTGMTEPTEEDKIAWNGKSVKARWEEDRKGIRDNFGSWSVGCDDVGNNLDTTGYTNYRLVPGDVLETLTQTIPDRISLLRLDTDWYKSTLFELEVLFPRLVPGGVLIIDDYGHFTGARQAVDEYFREHPHPILLNRIDYTGRIGIKQG